MSSIRLASGSCRFYPFHQKLWKTLTSCEMRNTKLAWPRIRPATHMMTLFVLSLMTFFFDPIALCVKLL